MDSWETKWVKGLTTVADLAGKEWTVMTWFKGPFEMYLCIKKIECTSSPNLNIFSHNLPVIL
jgi:hypothetical protein